MLNYFGSATPENNTSDKGASKQLLIRQEPSASYRNISSNSPSPVVRQQILAVSPVKTHKLTDDFQKKSGQFQSNRSLTQNPSYAIKSSVFRIEPIQNYADLKLDLTKSKVMSEIQSQDQQDAQLSLDARIGGGQLHPKKIQGPKLLMSTPGLNMSSIEMAKKQANAKNKMITNGLATNTSAERGILETLEKSEYKELRNEQFLQIDEGSSHKNNTCTCNLGPDGRHFSNSIDHASFTQYSKLLRLSSSPKPSKIKDMGILSFQLRPLKGKATHQREFKSMIEAEYQKEKKKQVYEAMYSPIKPTPLDVDEFYSGKISPNIRLNLRKETGRLRPIQNTHVMLRTISQMGGEITEEMVKLDKNKAELMNTTIDTLRESSAEPTTRVSQKFPWKKMRPVTPKKFFLFSPNSLQQSNQRYQQDQFQQVDRLESAKPVDIKIITSSENKWVNQGNQINLGYVGLHEQKIYDQFKTVVKDCATLQSTPEITSQAGFPFGRIYSTSRVSVDSKEQVEENKKADPITLKKPQKIYQQKYHSLQLSRGESQPERFRPKISTKLAQTTLKNKKLAEKIKQALNSSQPQTLMSTRRIPIQYDRSAKVNNIENYQGMRIESREESLTIINIENNSVSEIPTQQPPTPDGKMKSTPEEIASAVKKLDESMIGFGIVHKPDLRRHPREQSLNASAADWQHRINRQQMLMEVKMIELQKKVEHLGPLARQPVLLKNVINPHKPISQITDIDNFYSGQEIKTNTSPFKPMASYQTKLGLFTNMQKAQQIM